MVIVIFQTICDNYSNCDICINDTANNNVNYINDSDIDNSVGNNDTNSYLCFNNSNGNSDRCFRYINSYNNSDNCISDSNIDNCINDIKYYYIYIITYIIIAHIQNVTHFYHLPFDV